MDGLPLCLQGLAQCGDRGERREVEFAQRDVRIRRIRKNRGESGLALGRVAHGQDYLRAGSCQAGGDAESDAVAGSGDEGSGAGEVGNINIDCHEPTLRSIANAKQGSSICG